MSRKKFRTVSDDLLHVAEAAAEYMNERGYRVSVERQDLGFPHCPTLYCRRDHTTVVLEVVASLIGERMKLWVAYGKSCGHDFRVTLAAPSGANFTTADRDNLQLSGVGFLEVSGETCQERLAPVDLSINVELPALASLSGDVRELLGGAYDQFNRGNWREGFEAAAQSLEAAARRYFKRHLKSGRIVVVGTAVTTRDVDKMTLGRLAGTFERIRNQNVADTQIAETLDAINKDRIGVVHHRGKRRAEARLRTNVGKHMWAIVAAMKYVVQ